MTLYEQVSGPDSCPTLSLATGAVAVFNPVDVVFRATVPLAGVARHDSPSLAAQATAAVLPNFTGALGQLVKVRAGLVASTLAASEAALDSLPTRYFTIPPEVCEPLVLKETADGIELRSTPLPGVDQLRNVSPLPLNVIDRRRVLAPLVANPGRVVRRRSACRVSRQTNDRLVLTGTTAAVRRFGRSGSTAPAASADAPSVAYTVWWMARRIAHLEVVVHGRPLDCGSDDLRSMYARVPRPSDDPR